MYCCGARLKADYFLKELALGELLGTFCGGCAGLRESGLSEVARPTCCDYGPLMLGQVICNLEGLGFRVLGVGFSI